MAILSRKLKNFIRQISPKPIRVVFEAQRAEQLRKTAPVISRTMIEKDLKKLGLKKGDTIFLHSSLKSIGYVEGGAPTVIDAIIGVLGSSGTLIVPTYSLKKSMYKTCLDRKYIFDPRTAATQLGIIPATFLRYPGVRRSVHPTHSVSAVGKNARYITEAHHRASSTFGHDSPWDRLMNLDGKILAIGLKMGRNTFSHVLEDKMLDEFPLPVRMKQTFYIKCKDWDGNLIEVPVVPHDPKYKKIRMDQEHRDDLRKYFWKEFIRSGIIRVGRVGRAISWISSANDYYQHLVRLMREGITIYSSNEELKRRPLSEPKSLSVV
jgi:aminoglycoside N3'-acetyltransferase